ncbi:fungal transcriptional regulatory n-terminal [Fusarium pseudocircinatum]|uniref:Fungal transcriptional regulatory n-terminal n=1 Tax=Fusarium pseudocircinatum TaxID=56676 RepID=A0A8H5NP13_9HYPO|nr:fungal transcriptional regulatory n-terminal [Fusarium pseudocircinatum]
MCLAAHDLFNRSDADQQHQRQQFYSSMLQHKLRSIQDMRQLLSSSRGLDDLSDSMSHYEKDGFLITVMLHSLMEIATNSTSEWVVHTLGGLSMVKRYGHEPFSPEVYRFVTDHFSLSEAFLATTGTELEIEDLDGWLIPQRKSMFPILRSTHGRSRINPYTGISSELIQNITWITSTIQRHSGAGSDRKSAAVMRTELQVVENRLSELEQWSEDSDLEGLIYLNATAFEAAAWVYLRVAQYGCDAEEIQRKLMPKLFEAIRRVHERQDALISSVPYPLWALFIAACLAPEHERIQVLDWFEELKGCRSLSNVPSTMEAAMMVWKQHDLELLNGYPSRGRVSGVPWHQAIQCLGWRLSLT